MLQYIRLSRAWYAEANLDTGFGANKRLDSINVGDYDPDGGALWEFAFELYDLGDYNRPRPSVQLTMWDDAFMAFKVKEVQRLFRNLGHRTARGYDASLDALEAMLEESGFEDATPEDAPAHLRPRD